MSDVVYLQCVACGARVSGVRTELGSIIVPGRDGCPRCGSTDLTEVADADAADAADGGSAESSADAEVATEAEARVRERE